MKEFNENKEGGITTMENKYPLTAEQYLIKNYEDAKRENLQLKMQNKILENKLKGYEVQRITPKDQAEVNKAKIEALPVIKAVYRANLSSNYNGYYLNPERVEELKEKIEELKKEPSKATTYSRIGYVDVTSLNVVIELYGFKKYGRASVQYQNEMYLSFYNENDLSTFEDEYNKLIEDMEKQLKRWDDEYKAKWEAKQSEKS